jgi:hypothetical protein
MQYRAGSGSFPKQEFQGQWQSEAVRSDSGTFLSVLLGFRYWM